MDELAKLRHKHKAERDKLARYLRAKHDAEYLRNPRFVEVLKNENNINRKRITPCMLSVCF